MGIYLGGARRIRINIQTGAEIEGCVKLTVGMNSGNSPSYDTAHAPEVATDQYPAIILYDDLADIAQRTCGYISIKRWVEG